MYPNSSAGPQSGRSGHTIAEVVVAAMILMIGFAGVFGMLSAGRRSASISENHLAALHLARGVLEELRELSFYATDLNVGTHALPGGRGNYVVAAVDDGWNKTVTVNVEWEEPTGETRTVTLATLFSRSLHR